MNSITTFTQPTLKSMFINYMMNLEDALLVVEACLSGIMHHIYWFPQQNELQGVVSSGNTFVYAEAATSREDWDYGKIWMAFSHENGIFI